MNILVSNIMMLNERERFSAELKSKGLTPVFPEVNQFLSENELLSLVGEFDGWLAGDDEITEKVLKKALPRLKVISKWGTGIDSIDLSAAKKLGVKVFNSPGAFRDAVSEVALGYLLSLAREIVLTDRVVRAGAWPKNCTPGLVNQSLGIIGFGAIGKGIAERAIAFKMKVSAYDPNFVFDEFSEKVSRKDLNDIVETSDYLVLACNLTKANRYLINKEILAKMKPSACIVNVSRGALIKECDLIESLQNGTIAGAALDVFEFEPLPQKSPYIEMDNVVLGSHNANNMEQAKENVHKNTLNNMYSALNIAY